MGPMGGGSGGSGVADAVFGLLATISDPTKAKKTLEEIAAKLKAVESEHAATEKARVAAAESLAKAESAQASAEKAAAKAAEREAAAIAQEGRNAQRGTELVRQEDINKARDMYRLASTEFAQASDAKTRELQAREEAVANREAEAKAAYDEAVATRTLYEQKLAKLQALAGVELADKPKE